MPAPIGAEAVLDRQGVGKRRQRRHCPGGGIVRVETCAIVGSYEEETAAAVVDDARLAIPNRGEQGVGRRRPQRDVVLQ